jgi:predicted DNA-binding transcriptional regulator YafY
MRGLLLRAAANEALLEMIYQDDKGIISQRKIKVLTVSEDSFRAFCYSRKQQRTFKYSNVLSIGPVRNIQKGA